VGLLTIEEVAQRLRVCREFVRQRVASGEIRAAKIGTDPGQTGGRWLVSEDEVERWLAARMEQPK